MTMVPVSPASTHICNCACERCMAGGCCQFSTGYVPPTFTTTFATSPSRETCGFADHHYEAVDQQGHWLLFCRRCGNVRALKED